MVKRIFCCLLVMVAIASCASHRVLVDPKARLKITRGDLRELQESFKSTAEKKVVLPTLGEASCGSKRCSLSVKGTAKILVEGKAKGTSPVPGVLTFTPDSAALMLRLMDQAKEEDEKLSQITEGGEIWCVPEKCEIEFVLPEQGEITMDAVGGNVRWLVH